MSETWHTSSHTCHLAPLNFLDNKQTNTEFLRWIANFHGRAVNKRNRLTANRFEQEKESFSICLYFLVREVPIPLFHRCTPGTAPLCYPPPLPLLKTEVSGPSSLAAPISMSTTTFAAENMALALIISPECFLRLSAVPNGRKGP